MSSNGGVQFVEPAVDLKFAVSSVRNGTDLDLRMQLQVPQKYGWGAVAIGDTMAGATMFIVYPSLNDTGATLSIRSASGNVEPVPLLGLTCTPAEMTTTDSIINAAFTCYSLGSDPRLTTDPTASRWIYATGPSIAIASDSDDYQIAKHDTYGSFQLNMNDAFVSTPAPAAAAPIPSISNSSISSPGATASTSTALPSQTLVLAHATLLGGAFLVLFPLGVFFLRLHSVRLHWMMQLLASVACICGLVIATTMCATTTAYAGFDTAHQILGLVSVGLLFPLAALGGWGHRVFKRGGAASVFAVVHLNLGRLVVVLGWVAGVTGFLLMDNEALAAAYGIVAAAVFVAIVVLTVWDRRQRTGRGRREGMEMLESVRADHDKIRLIKAEDAIMKA